MHSFNENQRKALRLNKKENIRIKLVSASTSLVSHESFPDKISPDSREWIKTQDLPSVIENKESGTSRTEMMYAFHPPKLEDALDKCH